VPGWAQTRTLPTQTVTISGTVETIDHQKRMVNIKTPDGKFETIDQGAFSESRKEPICQFMRDLRQGRGRAAVKSGTKASTRDREPIQIRFVSSIGFDQ
jgi:hypothetical protein